MRTLVLGGARSGKSTHAERLVAAAGSERAVTYVATSEVREDDAEWAARVALHQQRRPASWRTVETLDVAGVLCGHECAADAPVVLVDCLGVWLTRVMDECEAWSEPLTAAATDAMQARVDELVDALASTRFDVVLVSNEVGQGVVPAHWSGRFFRDQLGILNMRAAAVCERVVFCVAGLPMTLKDPA